MTHTNIMEEKKLCVIRKYRTGDEIMIREIITEATMATVTEFFWAAVYSDIFLQVSVVIFALSFILFGIPFYYSLLLVPLAFVVIYSFLWMAHMFKAMELHEDLNMIGETYMKDLDCGFWVAEVLEEKKSTALDINPVNRVNYDFITGEEFDQLGLNIEGYHKRIVGTVAVTKSTHGGMRAWLRRMAVKKGYQRRGIASHLLDETISFCVDHCYEGIELLTTECHHKARELYVKRGFQSELTYYKHYLGVRQPMYLFYMKLEPPKANLGSVMSM